MFVSRMSHRGGKADQGLQPSSAVHHPHRGAKVQSQIQDGSREFTIQLLQKHHAAGCVRISNL